MSQRRAREQRRLAQIQQGPTLDEERTLLAELQSHLGSADQQKLAREISAMWESTSVAYRDQHEAAVAETRRTLPDRALLIPETEYIGMPAVELRIAVMAAVMRCIAKHSCVHATRGDRPMTAFPAARVIACDRCLIRFAQQIADQDIRAASKTDLTCDLCLVEQTADDDFHPFAVPWGPVVVRGDTCESCFALSTAGMVAWPLETKVA